jgi:acylphosphatase
MKHLEFIVKGSKGDEYVVTFEREDKNVRAFCTCQAGQNGLYCKHRFALMDGDVTAVLSANVDEVGKIKALLDGSDVEAAYARVLEAERNYKDVTQELQDAKKALARAMRR